MTGFINNWEDRKASKREVAQVKKEIGDWIIANVFTPDSTTPHNKLNWGSGYLKKSDGTEYEISAGTTGAMSNTTYIYFSPDISETELQITTTARDTVGTGNLLIGVANPILEIGKEHNYQIFGGFGSGKFITAKAIAANSITANEIVSNSITANEIATGTITTSELNFTPVEGSNVISSINASGEGIRIQADNIEISGSTTFTSGYDPSTKARTFRQASTPSGALTGDIWIDINNGDKPYTYNGSSWIQAYTQIDGGNITTGTVNANRIDVNGIFAQTINATGTITGATIRTSDTLTTSGGIQLDTINGFRVYDGAGKIRIRIPKDEGKINFFTNTETYVGGLQGERVNVNGTNYDVIRANSSGFAAKYGILAGTGFVAGGTSILKNIEPTTNITYDLGNSSYYWNNLYVRNISFAARGGLLQQDTITNELMFRGNLIPRVTSSYTSNVGLYVATTSGGSPTRALGGYVVSVGGTTKVWMTS